MPGPSHTAETAGAHQLAAAPTEPMPPVPATSGAHDVAAAATSQKGSPHEAVSIELESWDPSRLVTTRIYAEGICCPNEIPLIRRILGSMAGVTEVDVSVVSKTVAVRHAPAQSSPGALVAALNAARLDASLTSTRKYAAVKRSWLPPWNVLLAAALLIVSCVHYLAKPAGHHWLDYFKWAAIAAVAVGIPSILLKGLASLRYLVLDINILMTIAVAGAIAIGNYTEAATVVVLFAIADSLENNCMGKARDAIGAVLALKPDTAILASTGEEVEADSLELGTLILVKPGERVPMDGEVIAGASVLDESMLTGEATPVEKAPGDSVYGGTLNTGASPLQVRTTALAEESTVAHMARLVAQAAAAQSPMETLVVRFAKVYTPLVLVATACVAFIPWAAGRKDHKHWIYLALQILVTACPCALVLSTPVTVVSGLAKAAQQGVLIKGGTFLEALAHLRIVTFDKTGTLTEARFQVVHVEARGEFQLADVLTLAAAAEQGSSHPLAAAIVGLAAARGLAVTDAVSDSEAVAGQGLVAMVGDRSVAVGNLRLLESRCHECLADIVALDSTWRNKGTTVVWVAVDGVPAGLIAVCDSPRPEAAAAVAALQKQKLRCAMLTGDNRGAAAAVAAAVGLTPSEVHAELTPEDKLNAVARFKAERKGTLAHIGDGVNDAPALAAADIGIAMGAGGADVAVAAADVALFTNDLGCLPHVVRLGRLTRRKVVQNIAFAIVTKVAVLALASAGKFTLWGAVLVDVGAALLVILNGMTMLRWSRFPKGQRSEVRECAAEAYKQQRGKGECQSADGPMDRAIALPTDTAQAAAEEGHAPRLCAKKRDQNRCSTASSMPSAKPCCGS